MLGKRSVNKKVRNATKEEFDGQKFDSKLELFMYQQLKSNGIEFDFKPKYILQEKFKYRGEAIREITYTPDFQVSSTGMLIDVKGFSNDTFPLKKKMLFYYLTKMGIQYPFEMPKNRKECINLILKIRNNVS